MTLRRLRNLAIITTLMSLAGLGYVVMTQAPTILTTALFFPLVFLVVSSTMVLIGAWLRLRIGVDEESGVILRQGAWAGLYASLCAVLQLAQMLDAVVAVVLAAIFVLLELFLLQRPERIRRVWYRRTTRQRDSRSADASKKR